MGVLEPMEEQIDGNGKMKDARPSGESLALRMLFLSRQINSETATGQGVELPIKVWLACGVSRLNLEQTEEKSAKWSAAGMILCG